MERAKDSIRYDVIGIHQHGVCVSYCQAIQSMYAKQDGFFVTTGSD
jgi:hypothetical protein